MRHKSLTVGCEGFVWYKENTTTLPHPPYNPDLTSCGLKKKKIKTHLNRHHFGTVLCKRHIQSLQGLGKKHSWEVWQRLWNSYVHSKGLTQRLSSLSVFLFFFFNIKVSIEIHLNTFGAYRVILCRNYYWIILCGILLNSQMYLTIASKPVWKLRIGFYCWQWNP